MPLGRQLGNVELLSCPEMPDLSFSGEITSPASVEISRPCGSCDRLVVALLAELRMQIRIQQEQHALKDPLNRVTCHFLWLIRAFSFPYLFMDPVTSVEKKRKTMKRAKKEMEWDKRGWGQRERDERRRRKKKTRKKCEKLSALAERSESRRIK